MGPRSIDRGNRKKMADSGMQCALQWGRDQLIAETPQAQVSSSTAPRFNGAAIN